MKIYRSEEPIDAMICKDQVQFLTVNLFFFFLHKLKHTTQMEEKVISQMHCNFTIKRGRLLKLCAIYYNFCYFFLLFQKLTGKYLGFSFFLAQSAHYMTAHPIFKFYFCIFRLSITLSCPLDLTLFPMDTQRCKMQLESCM